MLTAAVTLKGRTAQAPELAHTSKAGVAVVELVDLVNRRKKIGENEYEDAEPTRHRVKAFGRLAENVAASITTGDEVTVHGQIATDAWLDRETQEKRTGDTVVAEDIAASLARATIQITRNPRTGTSD